ncbi:MAG: DNA topoisomerase III [Desulforhopalus sp.]|nr:DNA topoisomerase III [Desulforhopalus sp.]
MTEKILIIAEKPSVAADLVKSLPGKFIREKTHFEGDKYVVSFAIGHLVTICFPEEIDPAYQKWDMENLPILPKTFPLKGLDGTKSQLSALQKLIRRKDIKQIINACDAGREGELIFKYIVKFVWNASVAEKTFKRLWLQSMTTDSIRNAFASLRDNSEMLPLEDTALCRSESDWLIGINATRALTGYNSRKGGFFLTPCGRVQTPTLSLLVKRERARLDFTAKPYWNLHAVFACNDETYEGKWIDAAFARDAGDSLGRADRIWTKDDALAIIAKCTGKPAAVEEQSKKNSQNSPQLYDLTLLQREANSRFGFSAKNTLAIAQALYERHKVLTYPRTDSKHLPEDYLESVKDVLSHQVGWQFGAFAQEALTKNYVRPDKRIFNNSKISDHHAIIPTTLLPGRLTEPELKIYQMVVQRFLAVFFPPAVFLNTKRLSLVEGESFLTEGKILLEAGWKAIYGSMTGDGQDRTLSPIPDKALVSCREINVTDHETTPPPRFNEATLLSAMENSDKLVEDEELADAMKERGLGTPATRAAIIEKLIKEKYVVRDGKDLSPTGKAFELLALLEAMHIEVLASPEMTGEWEYKLNRMLKGQFTRDKFMAEIRAMTEHIIDQVKNFETAEIRAEAQFSPVNGVRYFSSPTAYISEDNKISIRKILGGRMMTETEIVDLLQGKTIGPFSDFRSKKGKPFTASVRLANKKIEFIFAASISELDIDSVRQGTVLGLSPIDQTKVFATPMAYMSESALEGDDKKGLKISKTILAKEISERHVRQLLAEGKTELIGGFISKRKKPFDAYLLLAKNGTLSFDFPPRKDKSTKQNKLTVPKEKGTTTTTHETD